MVTSLRHAQEVPNQERSLTPVDGAHQPSISHHADPRGLLQIRDRCRLRYKWATLYNSIYHTHTHTTGVAVLVASEPL